ILHQFYPEFSGGTERVALNLARSAQRAGHYVRILACAVTPDAADLSCSAHLAGAQESVYQGVPLTLLPRALLPASGDFSLDIEAALIEPIAGWMKHERFDLAHVMHTMRMSTAVLAAQHCGLPLILTLTDFFLACPRINLVNLDNQLCQGPQLGKKCGQQCLTAPWTVDALASRYQHAAELLASASVRVTPSEFVASRFRAAFAALDFRVIPHGIDLLALANQHGFEGRQPENRLGVRLVYVGGIIPQKGLDLLLRALALVKASNIDLKIIGGFHGAAAYHSEVLALGKGDARVEFLGHLEPGKVFEAIAQADLLCLPHAFLKLFLWRCMKRQPWECQRWCPTWARQVSRCQEMAPDWHSLVTMSRPGPRPLAQSLLSRNKSKAGRPACRCRCGSKRRLSITTPSTGRC
ncbi:MAG: glycosyltransferase, partial [Ferruginibacter sp.]